jgi:Fe2+ transport system protein FeoA
MPRNYVRHASIARFAGSDPEFLRYLSRLNLIIGAEVLVDQRVPYHDSLMLRLDDQRFPLGREMAALIRVEPYTPTRLLGKKSGGTA